MFFMKTDHTATDVISSSGDFPHQDSWRGHRPRHRGGVAGRHNHQLLLSLGAGALGPPAVCFFLFAAVLIPQLIFVWTAMPETKGRSLEEIEESFGRA
jgi:hypothetical protein